MEENLYITRLVVQKILTPIVVVFGVAGNLLNVVVLSRKCMRSSSTNLYLGALAVADTLYLLFTFTLSLHHYSHFQYSLWYGHYRLPYGRPLADLCSNTAVWLTVTFTLERFIGIQFPMKGKRLCTCERAKVIVVAVVLAALLLTLPEFFEKKAAVVYQGDCCSVGVAVNGSDQVLTLRNEERHTRESMELRRDTLVVGEVVEDGKKNRHNEQSVSPRVEEGSFLFTHNRGNNMKKIDKVYEANKNETNDTMRNELCCRPIIRIYDSSQWLKTLHYYQLNQILFTFLPLIILIIFNSLLIRSVLKAAKVRNLMTNNSSNQSTLECSFRDESKLQYRKSPRIQPKALKETRPTEEKETLFMKKKSKFFFNKRPKSQQNKDQQRITVMLIAVVVVFLLCQLPQAIQRILQEYIVSPRKGPGVMMKITANFFNLLVMINASCNFLLYSCFSRKFRMTFCRLCGLNRPPHPVSLTDHTNTCRLVVLKSRM